MSIAAIIISFLIILPAELPDKTVIACLVLGSRYRPAYVFAGAASAFAIQVALAVTAGGLLSLAPHRVTEIIVAVLFVVGAVILLRQKPATADEYTETGEGRRSFLPVALTSFGIVFVAEFGDLTQIVTANRWPSASAPPRACGWRRGWPSSVAAACSRCCRSSG
jgi:putative Ca2+/H+ antiporter (TMEM165/GDT1 family)